MTTIGVLGASGTVGRVAVDRLASWDLGDLRLGGRDLDRAAEVGARVPRARTEPVRVDLNDADALRAFCAGCDVVVNCAGPSYLVLDTVARAALAGGAHYVDAAGDAAAADALGQGPARRKAAVFSAGLMPGLSGLLPRLLAADGPPSRLDLYVGGAAAIGPLSAVDALLTRGPRFGTALAVWRAGAVLPNALRPLRSVTLPGFRGRVHAWPFLSVEAARLAAELDVEELRNYTVYVTEAIPRALAEAWADDDASGDGDAPPERHVPAVVAAADADLAATGPYYTMLFQAVHRDSTPGRPRRLVLHTPDSYALSGVVAALTVRESLTGRIPAGVHFAADVLDAAETLALLSGDPLVTGIELA
ncbi:Saccharopine dehydrogenase NADP binding domain-containing protein [Actinomadura madurae]|uniref:Saccharopine dehydrogenase NADP binding domain-containing protein n=1 Tax=Actinomadura madurae TaxID=1993 RepID=A0A1I5SEW1_9ACTN|nr:saccharopine dehydrogenase NADP-binding domain-containing protein [Actinomadura madurae]SFP69255.1 Saccharopine dehydrogenase NADP binding domain-containing protein [Actinomadura madurae]